MQAYERSDTICLKLTLHVGVGLCSCCCKCGLLGLVIDECLENKRY